MLKYIMLLLIMFIGAYCLVTFMEGDITITDAKTAPNMKSATRTGSNIIIVAASDTMDSEKAQADYVANGTEDQYWINLALTTVLNSGGGAVQLTSGNFYNTGAIVVGSNSSGTNSVPITLRGEGWSTIIHLSENANSNGIQTGTSYDGGSGKSNGFITLRDFSLFGNSTNNTNSTGIYFCAFQSGIFHVKVYDFKDWGIKALGNNDGIGNGENNWISQSYIQGNKGGGINMALNSPDAEISEDYIFDNMGNGIDFHAGDINIHNSHIYGNQNNTAYNGFAIKGTSSQWGRISDNWIQGGWEGQIYLLSSFSFSFQEFIISENNIVSENSASPSITLFGYNSSFTTKHIVVTGNTIRAGNGTTCGVYGSWTNNNTIIGNVFIGTFSNSSICLSNDVGSVVDHNVGI